MPSKPPGLMDWWKVEAVARDGTIVQQANPASLSRVLKLVGELISKV